MPVEKFGCTDRSEKLACPACSTTFLMTTGIGAEDAAGGRLAATLPEAALPDAAGPNAGWLGAVWLGAVWPSAACPGAAWPPGAAGSAATATTGALPGAGRATTVAPGP